MGGWRRLELGLLKRLGEVGLLRRLGKLRLLLGRLLRPGCGGGRGRTVVLLLLELVGTRVVLGLLLVLFRGRVELRRRRRKLRRCVVIAKVLER